MTVPNVPPAAEREVMPGRGDTGEGEAPVAPGRADRWRRLMAERYGPDLEAERVRGRGMFGKRWAP